MLSRTFDDVVHRITVLIRAADLLWPHQQDKALSAFMEAFDLAVQHYKEHGDQFQRTSQGKFAAVFSLPDQRFRVISALAKRDPARAGKLVEQIVQEEIRNLADNPPNEQDKRPTGEKLLMLAHNLAPTNATAAINLARQSLRYPASMFLTMFLYQVSRTNKQAADRFYLDALVAYTRTPMDQFLYLSAYPFGNARDAGVMPGHMYYPVPEGYLSNRPLQRAFMSVFMSRVEGAMAMPVQVSSSTGLPDQAQMWLALTRLEKQIQAELPDLFDLTMRSKERLLALLDRPFQEMVIGQNEADNRPPASFDELLELSEKVAGVGERDRTLATAVTGLAAQKQSVEKVLNTIDKVSDENLRASLLNWFYYFRARSSIESKNLTDARKFAGKVTELDLRVYLLTKIAEELLKAVEDQSDVRQMLNEIANEANKAPKTIVTARALLALAYLYARIDVNRGVEELGNAVRTINALEAPDFSQNNVMMKIEGKTFGNFASIYTPGFDPENAFREMGKLDFDGSLLQAATFRDKSLGALTTLAVIEPCFANTRK